jgi:hypothetical protein
MTACHRIRPASRPGSGVSGEKGRESLMQDTSSSKDICSKSSGRDDSSSNGHIAMADVYTCIAAPIHRMKQKMAK